MARPKRQQERRESILNATGRAIAQRGYGAVRVKDVAEEADLTPASVLYYYPDVAQLLVEAIHYATRRYVEGRREVAEALDDPADRLAATIRAGFPTDPYDVSVLFFQSVGAIRDNLGLRAMAESLITQQVELYQRILEVGESRGVFILVGDSRTLARNLVALEDAYCVYFIEGIVPTVDEAIRMVTAYAEAVTGASLAEAPGSQD